ncbi:3-hydroxyacyl-ACP dehydratase [Desulfocarbo indianensis]|nr:3-hydroxyacyl-ACP dehydratase [Desulfocarbo indianensis]
MSEPALDILEIVKLIPHRYPFLLVDRILEIDRGERVVGLKNVSMNEAFFQGHFPGKPVMPGVLVIEAMAQTGGILAYNAVPQAVGKLIYFMGMDKVKFRRPVVPGDQLIMEITMLHKSSRAWRMQGKATVEGQLAAQAELTAAIGD